MRVSGDHDSPCYWQLWLKSCPEVFLNGERVDHVVEADDDKGYVIVEVWEDGRPKIEGDHFMRRRIDGEVRIVA